MLLLLLLLLLLFLSSSSSSSSSSDSWTSLQATAKLQLAAALLSYEGLCQLGATWTCTQEVSHTHTHVLLVTLW